jgi:hypothetical protein
VQTRVKFHPPELKIRPYSTTLGHAGLTPPGARYVNPSQVELLWRKASALVCRRRHPEKSTGHVRILCRDESSPEVIPRARNRRVNFLAVRLPIIGHGFAQITPQKRYKICTYLPRERKKRLLLEVALKRQGREGNLWKAMYGAVPIGTSREKLTTLEEGQNHCSAASFIDHTIGTSASKSLRYSSIS